VSATAVEAEPVIEVEALMEPIDILIRLRRHPDDCTCERQPDCRGKYHLATPDSHIRWPGTTFGPDSVESLRTAAYGLVDEACAQLERQVR
jgi:hypothetical protein